ncbi:putative aldo-keto reductase 3 [Gracilariopsis chorda]|uniref:Putative aldo-keto reductase 3 n=1 Tax=Gracilariopsis chorda TaxID=448386 RepID=A0A2V3IDB5_9FLOR|nr:putative aldo-keto reductase 3 [Gracilariopsis chorda]|eukprot:PXF40076.1 putative aldo-keto reductase 3 [Gracilariopsis chorda]
MDTIALGSQGLVVSKLGFGCMGLTTAYGSKLPDDQIIDLLEKAASLGVSFWDTANLYVFFNPWRLLRFSSPVVCQEEIIRHAIERVGRDNVTIATKTGIELYVFPRIHMKANGSPAFIREQCEASLRRLNVSTLDLFYLHRIDEDIPIEISMTEMKKLVNEGKVRYVGLSEAPVDVIRRAHKVHPITAVQMEYSLWCRGIEEEVIPTCAELGIGLVAYSPLGRGFFGGASRQKLSGMDFRKNQARFQGEAREKNEKMLEQVEKIAESKGVSPAQLALAWVEAQRNRLGDAGLVAIPGTTKERNLRSNAEAASLSLTPEELSALEEAVPWKEVEGARYGAESSTWESVKNRELTPEEAEQIGLSTTAQ